MYKFICVNNHISHSASREQRDMRCPMCHEPARLQTEKDAEFDAEIRAIFNNPDLSGPQKRNAAGKAVRKTVERLKDEGKTVVEIADLVGLDETRVRDLTGTEESS